jgi:general secretion pathway protein D
MMRIAAALAVVMWCLAVPQPVSAAVVTGVQLRATPNGMATITVFTDRPSPAFRLSGAGALGAAVEIFGSSAAAVVKRQLGSAGAVKSVTLGNHNGNLLITIGLAAPVSVNAAGTPQGLEITVGAATVPTAEAPASPARAEQAPVLTGADRVVEIVPLKYADISEVAGVLFANTQVAPNDTFVAQPSPLGQSQGGTYGGIVMPPQMQQMTPQVTSGGGAAWGQRLSEDVAIDRRLNAVVLTGTRESVDRLHGIIEKLDVPIESVVLETEIVELSENAAKAVGIDFNPGGQLATVSLSSRSFNGPSYEATLQANVFDVVSRGGGRILARPRIVAQSGTSASILTGDAIPIVTSITSFGSSTITQQQVQYVQVGVNLQIQPRVSADGYVTSHVYSQVSSVTGYVQGFPQISQRIASTSATVQDGQPFVVGGLVEETEIHSLQKVPGVGDLPIIGPLFRLRRDSRVKQNLYIIVTPRVVHSSSRPPQPAR